MESPPPPPPPPPIIARIPLNMQWLLQNGSRRTNRSLFPLFELRNTHAPVQHRIRRLALVINKSRNIHPTKQN